MVQDPGSVNVVQREKAGDGPMRRQSAATKGVPGQVTDKRTSNGSAQRASSEFESTEKENRVDLETGKVEEQIGKRENECLFRSRECGWLR